jgi:hypothetical protein
MGGLEELQVGLVMHGDERGAHVGTVRIGLDDRPERRRSHGGQDPFGSFRDLHRWFHASADELGLGSMESVRLGEDRQHARSIP